MSPIPNPRVTYSKIPESVIIPGETIVYEPDAETIDVENAPLDSGVLVKTLYISADPYLRVRMRDPSIRSYIPAFDVGKPIIGSFIGVVKRSESDQIKVGDYVNVFGEWKAYNIIPAAAATLIQNPTNLPLSAFLGVAGAPGLTAFYSLRAYAKWKKGETCFVSTGAGAVGSVVAQLAKLAGLKVIASTGSDEKVEWLKELGVDVVFNYKKTAVRDVLKEHGPIDVYFDNVGAGTLDTALEFAKEKGRFILCGWGSEYNTPYSSSGDRKVYGLKNVANILVRELTVTGFVITNLIPELGGIEPFVKEYLPLVAEGKIKYHEDKTVGLEKAGEALANLLVGKNSGKAVIVVAEQ